MTRNSLSLALLLLFATLSGCHIADQAANVFTAKDTSNYLVSQQIPPISALTPMNFPSTKGHTGEVLVIHPLPASAPSVLSVGQDGRVLGWDLSSGQGHEIQHLNTSPKVLAVGETKALIAWADDRGITVACLTGCSQRKTFSRLKVRPTSLAFHDLDTSLLIGGTDGRIYRWRFMAEQEAPSTEDLEKMVERYVGHQTVASGVVGHSVGRAFFSSDWDGALIGWLSYSADDHGGFYDKNPFKGRFYTDIPAAQVAARPHDRGISALTISEDGEHIGVGTEDGHIEVWRVKGFMLAARKQVHQGRVTGIALSKDGDRIASVGKDSKVRVHTLEEDPTFTIVPTALPKLLQELSDHHIPLARNVAFVTPSRLAVSTKDGTLAEVKLEAPAKTVKAIPTPRQAPKARDSDY
jgi:WD40 repeat protein